MASVSIDLLSRDDVDEAYVLARLGDAGLTLNAWRVRAAARNASSAEGGVLLARDVEARPCGLAVYALANQSDGRMSLQIEQLIGFDMFDPRVVVSALISEAVRLSRATGCEALSLVLPLGLASEVEVQVLATGVAVLASLFWCSTPGEQATSSVDLGQGRPPAGSLN